MRHIGHAQANSEISEWAEASSKVVACGAVGTGCGLRRFGYSQRLWVCSGGARNC